MLGPTVLACTGAVLDGTGGYFRGEREFGRADSSSSTSGTRTSRGPNGAPWGLAAAKVHHQFKHPNGGCEPRPSRVSPALGEKRCGERRGMCDGRRAFWAHGPWLDRPSRQRRLLASPVDRSSKAVDRGRLGGSFAPSPRGICVTTGDLASEMGRSQP